MRTLNSLYITLALLQVAVGALPAVQTTAYSQRGEYGEFCASVQ